MRTDLSNSIERIKAVRDGLDVGADIPRFAELGWEVIPKDDVERLKWWGIFLRRQSEGEPGFFMVRIRIPNGIAMATQVRTIAAIVREQGRGIADVTTRQQVQMRWIRIETIPAILEQLRAVRLTTLQTGMDNVRNVVGCPLAGLIATELLDASPVVREFTARVIGNLALTNLPRKFNVTITGCRENCTHAETQDLALVPATRGGAAGFNVLVGGKVGSGGYRVAAPLDVFVTPEDAPALCDAVVGIFRDHGPREARNKARLAFLLDDWGTRRFRDVLEDRMGYRLTPAGRDERKPTATDHIGFLPQKQPGRVAVGLLIPVGRLNADQLSELARLAEVYGSGEVRFTTGQNVIIPHVPEDRLDALRAEPLLRELPPDPPPLLRGLVACTGTDYCNLALIETKRRALETARRLQEKVQRSITVHWSGCPAGCGNHPVADIGLLGKKVRRDGNVVEGVDVFVGGSSGPRANAALKLLEDVPCDELETVLEILIRHGAFESIRQHLRQTALSESHVQAQRIATESESPAAGDARREIRFRPSEIPEGRGRAFAVAGTSVAVFRCNGRLYAIQNACPHAQASLAEGVLEGEEVICPEHGYRFCLQTGVCRTDPALRARVFRLIPTGSGFRLEEASSAASFPPEAPDRVVAP